jgi:hypothetical protein
MEAFSMLWQMRAEEEGLSPLEAQDAVLRDNLFGLELDPRCVQIAMFAVVLQVWKAGGGWRPLPMPNIACSGVPVRVPVKDWTALAGGDEGLEEALGRLHVLFRDADTLGSLIDPRAVAEGGEARQQTLNQVEWNRLAPLLIAALAKAGPDPATAVHRSEAVSVARVADYLSRSYVLVVTNPPFLGANRQSSTLLRYSERNGGRRALDLAYLMKNRILSMAGTDGGVALVMPSEWLMSPRFLDLRRRWLMTLRFALMARLGYGSFETGLRVNPVLEVILPSTEILHAGFAFLDVEFGAKTPTATADALKRAPLVSLREAVQLARPDSVIAASEEHGAALGELAECRWGLGAGDGPRFERLFWEVPALGEAWEFLQSSTANSDPYSGRSSIVLWEHESGAMARLAQSVRHLNNKAQQWRSGKPFWGHRGVSLNRVGQLRTTVYSGDRFGEDCLVIVPRREGDLAALWTFARSGELETAIRSFDRGLAINPRSVRNVTWDVDYWRRMAEDADPLPEPESADPTQWVFKGRPERAAAALQVGVARLVGYRWPAQEVVDELEPFTDVDGIVCLPSVAGEPPAWERLHQLLAAAFGEAWSPAKAGELLGQAGSKKSSLAEWLRDDFFRDHCAAFGNRPFVWHVWDGLSDGFSALVNYHRLDRRLLEKLTYTYLGKDWVERQRAAERDGVPGAEGRLGAALSLQRRLEKILEGEEPFDIFVRWKAPHEQAIGWAPDVNDGVRLNVRPFVEAGVLRTAFTVHWRKDRGKNVDGSERLNDVHWSLAAKLEARAHVGGT